MTMESLRNDDKIRRQVQASVLGLALPMLFFPVSSLLKTLTALLVLYLVTGNRPYWIYVILKTLPRDLRIIYCMVIVTIRLQLWEKRDSTVAKVFHQLTLKHPDKVAFHADDGDWTYARMSAFAARFVSGLPSDSCRRGTPVALLLGTRAGPRLLACWLGLAERGAPAALLPPAARHSALLHALKASKAGMLVYSDDTQEAINEILDEPEMKGVTLVQYNMDGTKVTPLLRGAVYVNPEDETLSDKPNLEEIAMGHFKDPLIFIYTSGTTGLPKAAVITNSRYMMIASTTSQMVALKSDRDVVYSPLPPHHTAAGVLGAGQALVMGVTVVLRNKFSASNFWNDCVKYNCTVAQYIGEICRFLLLAHEKAGSPPVPQHKLRLMIGNGLRSSLWRRFQDTFRIPKIYEFYGATEGNTNMINITSQEGAIGFLPRFASFVSPILLIKCNRVTGEPLRDSMGLCISCKPCEPGLLIGKLNQKKRLYAFTGYVDKAANEKKMIRDVLQKGDCYFNSGDILIMDDLGFFYFKDRTGDTFRWRGENVSTTEVEGILTNLMELSDIVVYGVEIPHIEGKAGMAAIVDPDNKLDLTKLVKSLTNSLPPFARPIFLRVMQEIPLTTTFKMIKTDLRKDGFNVNIIKDKVYFLDPISSAYIPLTVSLYENICNGNVRL